MSDQTVLTPCIGVCLVDADGLCTGCGRSLEEIAAWGMLSDDERLAIMDDLPERLAPTRPASSA